MGGEAKRYAKLRSPLREFFQQRLDSQKWFASLISSERLWAIAKVKKLGQQSNFATRYVVVGG